MLPSSKFGGTCPPQGIFALQKSLRVGCDGGRGSSSQRGKSPRKEISRGNLLCAESGLTSLSYLRLLSVQKYVARPTGTTVCIGQPGVPEGPLPLCFGRSPEETIPKGFLWAISSRRLDTALLCAAKKRGVESPGWQASASGTLAPAPRQEVKRQPRQARPNLNLSLKPSQGFYKLRCCPAAAANETRAGFDKPLHMLRKLA